MGSLARMQLYEVIRALFCWCTLTFVDVPTVPAAASSFRHCCFHELDAASEFNVSPLPCFAGTCMRGGSLFIQLCRGSTWTVFHQIDVVLLRLSIPYLLTFDFFLILKFRLHLSQAWDHFCSSRPNAFSKCDLFRTLLA